MLGESSRVSVGEGRGRAVTEDFSAARVTSSVTKIQGLNAGHYCRGVGGCSDLDI